MPTKVRGRAGRSSHTLSWSVDPRARPRTVSPAVLVTALAVPLAGLVILLAAPSLDVHWEHHPSHFWLVLAVAALNVALGWTMNEASRRRGA